MTTKKYAWLGTALILVLGAMACTTNKEDEIQTNYTTGGKKTVADFSNIPFSLAQAIDDMGWKKWTNNHVDADHKVIPNPADTTGNDWFTEMATMEDYQNVFDIGKNVGTRLGGVFVLQDFDVNKTICQQAKYNSDGTWMAPNPDPMDATLASNIMGAMKENAAYCEFGIHGVSHEHYLQDGTMARAEFAHLTSDSTKVIGAWSWQNSINHMECWNELYRQYFPADTHSFPKTFVPPAHAFYYNQDIPDSNTTADRNKTTADLMHQYGVKYVNGHKVVIFTDQQIMDQLASPMLHGVSFPNRVDGTNWSWACEVPWYGTYNAYHYPWFPGHNLGWIEAHFCNMWDVHDAQDKITTKAAVAKWTEYLNNVNDYPWRFLAKNTVQNNSQYYYNHNATITAMSGFPGWYTIDNTKMPDEVYDNDILSILVLKTPLAGKHISTAYVDNGAQIIGTWEDDFGYGYLVIGHATNPMGRLGKDIYHVCAILGDTKLDNCVDFGKGTYNVYSLTSIGKTLTMTTEMYGTQDIKVRLSAKPTSAISSNAALKINSTSYDASNHVFTINATAADIQGVAGTIIIQQ